MSGSPLGASCEQILRARGRLRGPVGEPVKSIAAVVAELRVNAHGMEPDPFPTNTRLIDCHFPRRRSALRGPCCRPPSSCPAPLLLGRADAGQTKGPPVSGALVACERASVLDARGEPRTPRGDPVVAVAAKVGRACADAHGIKANTVRGGGQGIPQIEQSSRVTEHCPVMMLAQLASSANPLRLQDGALGR